ncbi:hypothetical protein [Clostridium sp.]|uniref:hypothetical protein n=1 Tax=Clostridium sp. TaxID=1506 RepID=UPI00290D4360|nr:hypothetical protein [Clostridium sp.]MDU3410106.1 hypothetical protein [Clostridium sp.]
MINKSITLQKQVYIGEGVDRKDIAFLNSQITSGYGMYSISIQILNKENLVGNEDYLKDEITKFEKEVKDEAVINGWNIMNI